jgi:regulator of cell morphogenesis and NO signaling
MHPNRKVEEAVAGGNPAAAAVSSHFAGDNRGGGNAIRRTGESSRHLLQPDPEAAVVDWVIDFPESLAVFQEFSIDYCCAGKSLEYACLQASANLTVVCAKLRVIVRKAATCPDPAPGGKSPALSDWVELSPPGWISRFPATTVDPLALAAEVYRLGQGVTRWLRLAASERWDNFQLQSLSAALFNRYELAAAATTSSGAKAYVGLLQLKWPSQSEAIQICLAELQQMLVAPLAVVKAVRVPMNVEHCPSAEALGQAEAEILAQQNELAEVVARLGVALRGFTSEQRSRALPPTNRFNFTDRQE